MIATFFAVTFHFTYKFFVGIHLAHNVVIGSLTRTSLYSNCGKTLLRASRAWPSCKAWCLCALRSSSFSPASLSDVKSVLKNECMDKFVVAILALAAAAVSIFLFFLKYVVISPWRTSASKVDGKAVSMRAAFLAVRALAVALFAAAFFFVFFEGMSGGKNKTSSASSENKGRTFRKNEKNCFYLSHINNQ
jgi:hypothetical protein